MKHKPKHDKWCSTPNCHNYATPGFKGKCASCADFRVKLRLPLTKHSLPEADLSQMEDVV